MKMAYCNATKKIMLKRLRKITDANNIGIFNLKQRVVESGRPDIIIIKKECKELLIIVGSIPGDMNLS